MTASVWTGPLGSIGPMAGSPGTSRDYTYESGPSFFYEGQGFPDQRFTPINKDNLTAGSMPAHWDNANPFSVIAVPSALAAANIVAAATATSGTAMTLAGASTGIATNIPIQAWVGGAGIGTASLVTAPISLDYGFDTLNCTAGSATVTPAGSIENYLIGTRLVVANVGNSGGTSALLTYVKSVNVSGGTVTLNDAPQATNSAAPVGNGNVIQAQTAFPAPPTFAQPIYQTGPGAWLEHAQMLMRGVRVVSNNAADTGWTMTIVGYDGYGQYQTEAIAVTANSTAWGKKTWKYIVSATPSKTGGGSSTGTLSVGTSDLFGFSYRNLLWETVLIYWAGAQLTASTGWVAGDTTSPATSTTKDPRGTIQIGTNGPSGSGATGGASNGTLRLVISQTLRLTDMLNQSDQGQDFHTIYGVVPA